jgi:hypothetical protein
MIPEAKQPAVARALNEAFGVKEFEDICRLTAGLTSALVFRIVVRRHPYLLRVITRTDDISDPTRQFACMKGGAERGIAPRVYRRSQVPGYADNAATGGVSRAPARLGARSPIGHGFGERLIRLLYGQQHRGFGARHSAGARGGTERSRADMILQVHN